jgi:hypothetical protein
MTPGRGLRSPSESEALIFRLQIGPEARDGPVLWVAWIVQKAFPRVSIVHVVVEVKRVSLSGSCMQPQRESILK